MRPGRGVQARGRHQCDRRAILLSRRPVVPFVRSLVGGMTEGFSRELPRRSILLRTRHRNDAKCEIRASSRSGEWAKEAANREENPAAREKGKEHDGSHPSRHPSAARSGLQISNVIMWDRGGRRRRRCRNHHPVSSPEGTPCPRMPGERSREDVSMRLKADIKILLGTPKRRNLIPAPQLSPTC